MSNIKGTLHAKREIYILWQALFIFAKTAFTMCLTI